MRQPVVCVTLAWMLIALPTPRASPGAEEPKDRFGLTAAEAWTVNHFQEVVQLSFPIEGSQRTLLDPPRANWTVSVCPTYGLNPTLVRMTKADGKITAQRKRSTSESFWEAAVAARRADPTATAETVAQRLTFTLSDYDQDSCPSLIDLGARFESLTFGPITKVVTATGGQFYRYRVDFAPGHWIEGRLFGTGRVDRNLNPAFANWIEELSSALDECDRR